MRKIILLILLILSAFSAYAVEADSLRIAAYNVENLFYPTDDPLTNDDDFTPAGKFHWNTHKYWKKQHALVHTITHLGGWKSIDLLALSEIENDTCLIDLCHLLTPLDSYQFIHFDSPDHRGIDVALLYGSRVEIISSKAIPVPLDSVTTTRDILYAHVATGHDSLHLFVCHLPSQLGGTAASEWKRQRAKSILKQHIDSIQTTQTSATILVMGDMNSQPKNDLPGLTNLMLPFKRKDLGTHKYQGLWTCLDQFYISTSAQSKVRASIFTAPFLLEEDTSYLGERPNRTFVGWQYHQGYSDHLPILLTYSLQASY